jgi:hypothetical protein
LRIIILGITHRDDGRWHPGRAVQKESRAPFVAGADPAKRMDVVILTQRPS